VHIPVQRARVSGCGSSAVAAASLAGMPLAQARVALRDLTRASLLMEVVPGRFAFHDLLRAYAAEQAEQGRWPTGSRPPRGACSTTTCTPRTPPTGCFTRDGS
jgi:hypothetical protein